MRQTNTARSTNRRATLRVVKNETNDETKISKLVKTAWNFAYSALWNCTQFSSKEINAAKEKIEEYLLLSKNPEKALLIFCQRVLLARQYVNKSPDRFIPLPSLWLDRNYEFGFAGTKNWYDEIKAIRDSLPAYKAEIKALAEAALEFSEEPTTQNYQYWRQYFIDKQTPGLLNLFQVIAVQQIGNA
jgi:hypothetical protein